MKSCLSLCLLPKPAVTILTLESKIPMAKEDTHMYGRSLEFCMTPEESGGVPQGTYAINADPGRLYLWPLETKCSTGCGQRRTREQDKGVD